MGTDQYAAVEEEVPSVGLQLRRRREVLNTSLETAAEATKISRNYLRALEDDRYQDLPGPAYLQGFLRTYAVYLGLPADELLATVEHPNSDQQEVVTPSKAMHVHGFRWQRLLLPLVLLGALLFSTFFISQPPDQPRSRQLPFEQAAQTTPLAPATAVQHTLSSAVQSSEQRITPESQRNTSSENVVVQSPPPSTKPQDGFLVRMRVKQNSALTVTIDDATVQGYELTSGDLIEWKASRSIALDLSDAGSVEVELNGKQLKLPGQPGRSLYLVLDAEGIKK